VQRQDREVGEVNLPSIIPSYVYTLFASVIVGTLIICTCGLSISDVKRQAEEQQLSSIVSYVTSKSMELISSTPAENLTSTAWLNLPTAIGGQAYWVRFTNDTSEAWIIVGLAASAEAGGHQMVIPSDVSASGTFKSSSGRAMLRCYSDNEGIHLTIMEAN
jgi:hypothetical protein